MENNNSLFIKTDNNKIINKRAIVWVKKMNECLDVCVKSDGCTIGINTHKICKINSPESYSKLNNFF